MVNEKAIAQKWMKSLEEHEASWVDGDENTFGHYTSERSVPEIFADSLTPEERMSGFAMCLNMFGAHWYNDAQDVCNSVLNGTTSVATSEEIAAWRKANEEQYEKEEE